MMDVAEQIAQARRAKRAFPELPEEDRPRDEKDGYKVQAAVHAAMDVPLVGWKVGCTNPVMQELLGIPGPAVGGMTTVWESGFHVPFSDFTAPGIECEIAFRMGKGAPNYAPYDLNSISRLVDAAMVSMEVVDNRYGDIAKRPVGEMIADDFFHVAGILGTPDETWSPKGLKGLKGTSEKNGVVQGEGLSGDVMGHPLNALAFAANKLRAQNRPLQAGQIITTGTIAPVLWVDEPGEYAIEVETLGRLVLHVD